MSRLITVMYVGDRLIGKIDKCKDCEWLNNDTCTYEGSKSYDGLKPCEITTIWGDDNEQQD